MTAACTIREARTSDLDALVELLGMLFSLEADFAVDARRQRDGLLQMLEGAKNRLVLVADTAGVVVGMATAQVVVSTAEGGPSLLVEDVVVRPESRGLGIGRALLTRIEAWGTRLGATRLQLLADRDNAPSHDFYRACGFMPTNLVCLRRTLP
ncbi:MAG: GNAT family N-acetyltransferase [Humidesulfovibrio sp.]|uniref:GNAT family N-acetyltransferase n=1 Tax=Humidesulfovibrio sp. TaxID=2910988 RepID=UPI0027ED6291|nr:GNAT family N-acetyltransferase [Humidesulfovibrio sp.]MDQ7835629.1 GNAT family N-acetyltransferase [Humidesulfovibrio sp.]